MSPAALDANRIRALLERLCAELEGEWLLVGGALVAVWLDGRRTTEDLDLVGLEQTAEQRYRLLDYVSGIGLSLETVNSAADYFVYRIPGWRGELVTLLQGARATLYRPTPTLFLLLKVGRMSEQDLLDCLSLLEHCARERLAVDVPRVLKALRDPPQPCAEGAVNRRKQLEELLERLR